MININKCKLTENMKREIRLGTPFEMEHTKSKKKARIIASQHVCEFPNYYSKGLIPMEKKLRRR